MTINLGLPIDIAAPGAVSSPRKRIDIAPLKPTIAGYAEWVCAAEIFPQMGRLVGAPGRPFAAKAKGKTDTKSDVLVAASKKCHRFATHFATDQRLVSAKNAPGSQPFKDGGRGSDNQRGGAIAESDLAHRKFLPNGPASISRIGKELS
jgi:hypothetical protein